MSDRFAQASAEIARLVDREVDAIDRLQAEVRGGIRSARHFDTLEEQAQAIARGLIAAFRGDARP